MNSIKLKAMAKINLGLDVVRRRPDGYHEVRMVMQMVNLYDQIYITRQPLPGIALHTNLPYLPEDSRNIAYRAAQMLIEEFDISSGVKIDIEKHIPVAAGMAGGSTDCAAVLYGMNRLFRLKLSRKELMARGVKLGADVPYCLLRATALSEGIGEVLTTTAAMPACEILIAKPPVSVSTKFVYEHLQLNEAIVHPDIDGIVQALGESDLQGITDRMGNVLETVTVRSHPVIEEIKQVMRREGAMNALMSGSGPTVFGIFDNRAQAQSAYRALRRSGLAKQIYLTRPFNEKEYSKDERI